MKKKEFVKLGLLSMFLVACTAPSTTGDNFGQDTVNTVVVGRGDVAVQSAPAMPGLNVPAIKVNTVGYALDWSKMLVFNVDPTGAVVKDLDGKVVLSITNEMVSEHGLDRASQDPVWQVDISSLNTPGTYMASVGEAQSDPFVIDAYWKVNKKAVVALVKSFYFQRTRTTIDKPYGTWEGNDYLRSGVSHTYDDVGWDWEHFPKKKAKWQQSEQKKWWPGEQIKKGWFDAGNFDMYIPSTAPSAQILLTAYRMAPALFKDGDQNIPESGNNVPDLLDEITWGLDWIMSMQQTDGGFRHSEAVEKWTAPIPADEDKTDRWIRPVSTSSTAKAVAVLAMASSVYKKFPPYAQAAAQYEEAAKLGWEWLKKHPEQIRWDSHGSPQPMWDDDNKQKNDKGEFIYNDIGARWAAAAEMWIRFRDDSALEMIKDFYQVKKYSQVLNRKAITTGSWPNIARYGLVELALDEETPEEIREFAKGRLVDCADNYLLPRAKKDGHKIVTDIDEYYWGHNANLAEKAHMLAMTSKITGNKKYMEVARDQWHWLMGRNPNGFAMATGVGKGAEVVYHMEWGFHDPPPPGYALGGPNYVDLPSLSPDAPAKALLWDNQEQTRVGTEPNSLWHWRQEDLWDGGFEPEGRWEKGWWCVTETDLLYSADFVLAAIAVK